MAIGELSILQHIATNRDTQRLSALEADWFESEEYKHVINVWKSDRSMLEKINFMSYVKREELKGKISIPKIYSIPSHNYDSALKNVQDNYLRKILDNNILTIREELKRYSPSDTAFKLRKIIDTLPTFNVKRRKLLEGLNQENPLLFKLGTNRRPFLKNAITPLYKNLMVYAGESGMMKTAIALDTLDSALEANLDDPDFKVGFFSKEMDFGELEERLIANKMGVPYEDICRRVVNIEKLKANFQEKFPQWIDRFMIYSPEDWKKTSGIARIITEDKLNVWAVDFLQVASSEDKSVDKQVSNVIEFMGDLRVIARTTETFGIPLSQFKQKDKNAQLHFPRLEMIEWGGIIRQLAYYVGLVFWAYNLFPEKDQRVYIISWQKNRGGKTGNELLEVEPEFYRFKHNKNLFTKEFLEYEDL